MPYIKKIYNAGGIIEVKKTYSARFGVKGISRSGNCNPTPLEVEKVNDANAEQTLRLQMFTNFKANDWHLVFTYRPKHRPTPEQAKTVFKKQIKKIREYFKKELGMSAPPPPPKPCQSRNPSPTRPARLQSQPKTRWT